MPLYMIVSYLSMFGINMNLYIWYPCLFVVCYVAIKNLFLLRTDPHVIIFIIYSFISVGFYAINDTPIDCFIVNVKIFLLPIAFYYIGCSFAKDKEFKMVYLLSCLICFFIGFYLYYTTPTYYVQYMAEMANDKYFNTIRSEDSIMSTLRFSSFLNNSYQIEFLAPPALIYSLEYANRSKNKFISILFLLFSFVCLYATILSQQRAAMVYCIVVIFLYLFTFSTNSKGTHIIITLLCVCFVLSVLSDIREFVSLYFNRFEVIDITSDFEARYNGFGRITALSALTGLGLGACGQMAEFYHLSAISDAEFARIFCEYGLFGFTLFIVIIINTLVCGFKLFNQCRAEVLIILFFLFSSLVSNALSNYVCDFTFWYSMGVIFNKNLKAHA